MPLMRSFQGDHRRPACVFLHGFLGAKEDWEEMVSLLSELFFCIAFDLPGHGNSPAISDDYLHVLSEEIESCAGPQPILIGYSLGGRLALQLAQADPSRYSHVILLSAHPGISEKERTERLAKDLAWIDKLKSLGMEAFLKEWYDQPLFASLHRRPDLLQTILEKRKNQDPQKMADVLWMLSPARQKQSIASFHPRTLFLYGEEDEKYQKIYSALPKEVALRKIQNSGHAVHLENPMACALRIKEWLEEFQ